LLPEKKQLFPYTTEILEYLSEKKYELHIITNGFELTQKSKIGNSGIDRFFRHVITSEASNSLKPKKEIFEFAIGKSGAVLEESIMVGDNPDADIQGAINAGMDSIFVNHTGTEVKVKPTYTVNHLQELEQIF
jgi:putative hydrolase of the HAD superfamily